MRVSPVLLLLVSGRLLSAGILISEVMVDPLGPEASDEFVELVNTGPDSVDLADWSLREGNSQDRLLFDGTSRLAPDAWLLILDPAYAGSFDSLLHPGTLLARLDNSTFGNGGLGNSGGEWLELLDPSGQPVDGMLTRQTEPGFSLERLALLAFCDSCFNQSNRVGGTPGYRNSRQRAALALCIQSLDTRQIDLLACGEQGFRGDLWVTLAERRLSFPDLDLEPGDNFSLELPRLDWGQNPVSIVSQDSHGEESRLLDSLLWNPDSPAGRGLWLSELQPAGPGGEDWIELEAAEVVWLDGLALDWGRGPLHLSGRLDPGQFLLVGRSPADAALTARRQDISLSLNASSGQLRLLKPDGDPLEGLDWDADQLRPGASLERSQARLPAGLAANWGPCVLPVGHTAGSANSRSPQELSGGRGVQFSTGSLTPGTGPPLTVRLNNPAGAHQASVACWNLDGRLCRVLLPWGSLPAQWSLIWDGTDDAGRHLRPGVYLIQIRGSSLNAVKPLVIRP
ncbi:MAG: lamin tail domain-containing protein [Candidatus Delongbacteria bacterium]|nr:lamin tail domain-containing protein [Candidatus Delongbacteria bacterium]